MVCNCPTNAHAWVTMRNPSDSRVLPSRSPRPKVLILRTLKCAHRGWDIELTLDAAVLPIQQTDLTEVARRDPAVWGRGHRSHVRRERRDHFAPAQSPRVPEFDRAIVFGGRHE